MKIQSVKEQSLSFEAKYRRPRADWSKERAAKVDYSLRGFRSNNSKIVNVVRRLGAGLASVVTGGRLGS